MRKIKSVVANPDWTVDVAFEDGACRRFDVRPLLQCEAFASLSDMENFKKIHNCGYFIQWETEADLSADTLYLKGLPR